jgi:2-octaprenyl-6-methoxyphenol hydroxylase
MYDVIIVGRSFAGILTALTLKKYLPKLNICLIDQAAANAVLRDHRATALSPSSIILLNELNIWQDLAPLSAPIYEIHIGMTPIKSAPLVFKQDHQVLGYNVLNHHLRSLLNQNLNHINVDAHTGSAIKDIQLHTSFATATLDNNTQIQARLVIGADGRTSGVRRLLSTTRTIDHHQTAFTGTVYHTIPHNNRAFEFFIPQGPLAFIPLEDLNTSTFVWSLKNQLLPITSLEDTLSKLMHPHLGNIQCTQPVQQYPLKTFTASPRAGQRWVLVGDAANAIHPVAGQGLNLAIRDIQNLAHHLSQQHLLGLDIGSLTHLSQYAHARQIDRYTLLSMTHVAARWMTAPHKAISLPLEKGMKYLNRSTIFSDFLVNTAQFGVSTLSK